MVELGLLEGFVTLLMLVSLQVVLGFDNLLYIAIESRRAPPERQAEVRRLGIIIAVVLRIVLLFLLLLLLGELNFTLFSVNWPGVIEGDFTFKTLVFLLGGVFIMYTAMKEIAHMLAIHEIETDVERAGQKSARAVIVAIVTMNLVFSFDSVLSAIAITEVFALLAAAIVISGTLMLLLADRVAEFLSRNRMYEVLGLFILLLVGVLLLSEGGHSAHLRLFGVEIEALSKGTFYFAVAVMVLLDIVQSRYQRKLMAEKKAEIQRKL